MPHTRRDVDVPQKEPRYYDVRCDGCNKPLKPALPAENDGGWRYLQAMDALRLRLMGDYGAVWDDYDETFILCSGCVMALKGLFSTIGASLLKWENGEGWPNG